MLETIKKIQSANKAFLEWKNSTREDRLRYLHLITENYKARKNEIITSEAQEQKLPLDFTEKANYQVGLKILEDFKNQLETPIDKSFFPNGVMSIILSWNLANRLFIEKALAAVFAGNTVIVKFSSITQGLQKIWQDILKDLPEHVIQFVPTYELLVTHPGIRAVAVTGTLETCAQVLKQQSPFAEKQFKKVSLSSGSKNSCIVLDEPNEKLVSQVLETFLIGQGQLVWNSARLFILEKYQRAWVDAITENFKKLKPQPLVKTYPGLNYEELKSLAVQAQAKLITSYLGGPLFTYDMSNCSELQQDELRMPLFVLSTVKYGFDIPKYANVSYYGHSANIFSASPADKIIQQLDVGRVSLNQWSIYGDPFISAVKQSAYGFQDHQIFGAFYSNVKITA